MYHRFYAYLCRISDEGYYFTGAAENDVEKENKEAKNSETVQAEVPPNRSETLDNDMKIQDLILGNTNAKMASNGSKVILSLYHSFVGSLVCFVYD